MFERICSYYNPKHVIIHEVNNKNTEELTYTDLTYFSNHYTIISEKEFDLQIPVGKRTILDVEYRKL